MVELGKLLCGRARLKQAEGDSEEARRILAEAGELAEKAGAGTESELGRILGEACVGLVFIVKN